MVVLSIAIPAVVFLALLLVFAASRRNEAAKAEGQLSKETLQRDISSEKPEPEETGISQISGKEIERAAGGVLDDRDAAADLRDRLQRELAARQLVS